VLANQRINHALLTEEREKIVLNPFFLLQECCEKGIKGCCLRVNQNEVIVNHMEENSDQDVSQSVFI